MDKSCRPRKEGGPDSKTVRQDLCSGGDSQNRVGSRQVELRRWERLQFCADEQRVRS